MYSWISHRSWHIFLLPVPHPTSTSISLPSQQWPQGGKTTTKNPPFTNMVSWEDKRQWCRLFKPIFLLSVRRMYVYIFSLSKMAEEPAFVLEDTGIGGGVWFCRLQISVVTFNIGWWAFPLPTAFRYNWLKWPSAKIWVYVLFLESLSEMSQGIYFCCCKIKLPTFDWFWPTKMAI